MRKTYTKIVKRESKFIKLNPFNKWKKKFTRTV